MGKRTNCWVAVDKDGTEKISNNVFIRRTGIKSVMWGLIEVFYSKNDALPFMGVELPKGTIEKILGKKLTWKDEPVNINEILVNKKSW